MAGGLVDRTLLQSFYQNPGDIYDDQKTEGAYDVIADQVDANWSDYAVHNHDDRYYTESEIDAKFIQYQAGGIVDSTITNAKLATDVKVGSLAALQVPASFKTDFTTAINYLRTLSIMGV